LAISSPFSFLQIYKEASETYGLKHPLAKKVMKLRTLHLSLSLTPFDSFCKRSRAVSTSVWP